MLWHFQNKLFLSGNADMYVLSPYILGSAENVCHVSFILEAPKLHVWGLSFFFPRHFFGVFLLASFNSCRAFASAEARKERRVTRGMGGSHPMLAKGPGSAAAPRCVLGLTTAPGENPRLQLKARASPAPFCFPSKLLKEELRQQGIDACSFSALGFKWPHGWFSLNPSVGTSW